MRTSIVRMPVTSGFVVSGHAHIPYARGAYPRGPGITPSMRSTIWSVMMPPGYMLSSESGYEAVNAIVLNDAHGVVVLPLSSQTLMQVTPYLPGEIVTLP